MARSSPLAPALLLLLALLPACASSAPRRAPEAGTFSAPSRPITAQSLYPDLRSPQVTVRHLADDAGGLTIIDRTSPNDDGAMVERIASPSGDPEGPGAAVLATRRLALHASGAVTLLASTNPGRNIHLAYDPPLVVAPALLRPDHPHQAESAATELGPEGVSAEGGGTARYRLELVGERTSEAGTEVLIRSTLDIRLGRSLVTHTTDRVYFVGPDDALTLRREVETQTVSAMGFTVSRRELSLRPAGD